MAKPCYWHFILRRFTAVWLSAASLPALTAPWKIQGELLSEKNQEKLQKKFPDINSPHTLQMLLREIHFNTPTLELYAERKDDHWYIAGKKARLINEINFQLVTRSFRNDLENLIQIYLRQVDSNNLRVKIRRHIVTYLHERGFPNSEAKITSDASDTTSATVSLDIKVDLGFPCLIESVKFGFRVPKDHSFNIEEGDTCDQQRITDALQELEDSLRDEGYNQLKFLPPEYQYNNKKNTMRIVIPGTLGKKIIIKITDKENRFNVSNLFADEELSSIDPGLLVPEAMASDIAQRYRNKGYDDVVVNLPIITEKENTTTYTFEVISGPLYEISNIQFQGAKVFKQNELLDAMGLAGFWQTSPPLNLTEIHKGIESVKAKYQALGYWDAIVRDPRVTKNKETGQVQMVILIDEGNQRLFANLRIRGNNFFATDEIRDLLKIKSQTPLNQTELINFEKELRNKYVSNGFLYAEIKIDLEYVKGLKNILTTVNVEITENARVKIGEIKIVGLSTTHPKVITRELYFSTGDWYNPDQLDQSRRALLALGLFQTVQILPADRNALTEKQDMLDLLIEVREGKPGKISFGPGWSLFRGQRYGVEASYNNIGGVGRQVFAKAKFSEEANQDAIGPKTLIGRTTSVGYLEPHIFELPIDGTISVSNTAVADDKWILTRAGEVDLIHKLRVILPGSTVSLFYGQKVNREESSGKQQEGYLDILGGNVRVGRVGVRYKIDDRNDLTWPSSGYLLTTEYSLARIGLGGELAYNSWEVGNSHYFEIVPNWVIAIGVSLASFYNVKQKGDRTDLLPISETLHLGGADTVRGFRERSLGPVVTYDQFNSDNETERVRGPTIGGSNMAFFKTELRHQIVQDTFALTYFIDGGNVFYSQKEINRFKAAEAANNARENAANANAPKKKDRKPAKEESEIVDNVDYRFEQLVTEPDTIWKKNYFSYGLSVNYLTALGSINFSYGLPWKRCAEEGVNCIERGKRESHWLLNGIFHINIGANF